ncbi:HEAT repeat domain-containing protein [Halomicrobium zhouii]|uniref:HEAT repeat domain-containing protein n=1 Tax=Halomicrobium zhouii TaxID=767519 RepID=UPI000B7DED4C
MDSSDQSSPGRRLPELVADGDHERALERADALATAPVDQRKAELQSLRAVAEDDPTAVGPVAPALERFLADDERAVRLSTAKLFVAVAEGDPGAVAPVAQALADRLADESEFYYVRARAAEALGYVAVERPDDALSPEVLADLRVGLSFDEPEVTVKLAKALEHVALGNPGRIRHHADTLAEHLDDDRDLVRYHLATALVVVACDSPEAIADTRDALVARLADENDYVRGRAAEALGVLAHSTDADRSRAAPRLEELRDEEGFVADRARFAARAVKGEEAPSGRVADVGSPEAIREQTEEIAEAIAAPDADGECPHCGLALPEPGPPMCPRCGAPR